MSIQSIPPVSQPTTAGQLAARATANDQALASWLGDHDGRIGDLESRSGTSGLGVQSTTTPGVLKLVKPGEGRPL